MRSGSDDNAAAGLPPPRPRAHEAVAPARRELGWRSVLPLATAFLLALGVPALLYLFARPLALFVLAFTLAQAIAPLADLLDRRLPRALGVVLLYLTGAGVVTLLGVWIAPTLYAEAQQFAERAPALVDRFQEWLAGWAPGASIPWQQAARSAVQGLQETLMRLPMQVLGALFDILVVLFLSLYLAIAGPRLKRFAVSLTAPRHRTRTSRLMHRVGRAMGGYVRGAVISALFVGLLVWTALSIIGLEYARALALAAALGEFVPYLGPILAAIPALLVAISTSPHQALVVGLLYLGLQQLESYVITPNVMRTQTDLHPSLVILALAAGFSVGGLLGALAALPVFAALRVLLLAATPAIRRWSRSRSGG